MDGQNLFNAFQAIRQGLAQSNQLAPQPMYQLVPFNGLQQQIVPINAFQQQLVPFNAQQINLLNCLTDLQVKELMKTSELITAFRAGYAANQLEHQRQALATATAAAGDGIPAATLNALLAAILQLVQQNQNQLQIPLPQIQQNLLPFAPQQQPQQQIPQQQNVVQPQQQQQQQRGYAVRYEMDANGGYNGYYEEYRLARSGNANQ